LISPLPTGNAQMRAKMAFSTSSSGRNDHKEWTFGARRQLTKCTWDDGKEERTFARASSIAQSSDIAAPNGKCTNEGEKAFSTSSDRHNDHDGRIFWRCFYCSNCTSHDGREELIFIWATYLLHSLAIFAPNSTKIAPFSPFFNFPRPQRGGRTGHWPVPPADRLYLGH